MNGEDHRSAWFMMLLGFALIVAWASVTLDFQRDCELACVPDRALTPMVGFKEVCLCSEGQGRWREINVR